jgi:hypothetical protein
MTVAALSGKSRSANFPRRQQEDFIPYQGQERGTSGLHAMTLLPALNYTAFPFSWKLRM